MKKIEEMDFSELTDWCTGYTLMALGRGETLHGIVNSLLMQAIDWKVGKDKKLKGKGCDEYNRQE